MNCYEFGYDGVGRLTSSRSPGMTAPNQTRYSRAGRVVAERTAAMASGKWLVHFYDNVGRRVVTVEVTPTEAQLKTLQNEPYIATYSGASTLGGYTIEPEPEFSLGIPKSAFYYDTYSFRALCSDSRMPSQLNARPGLLTGSFDGENCIGQIGPMRAYSLELSGFYTMIQYDDWGRVVRTDRQTLSGVLTDARTLDRQGNVLTTNQTLTRSDGSVLSLSGNNTLDGAGRVKKWSTQFGDASAGATIAYGQYGSVSNETFANNVKRTYSYDCHGWLTEVSTIPNLLVPVVPLSDVSSQFYAETMGAESPSGVIQTGLGYVEQILYANGNKPRYDGTASAHVSSLGGRYDFTFDNHDRLTAAAYSSSKDAENFSTQYSYNALGAPITLKRNGVNSYSTRTGETFGTLDNLTYSWDGARLSQVSAQANGTDFYGRTGFQLSASGGTADFQFNAAGLLTKDTSRNTRLTKIMASGRAIESIFAFTLGQAGMLGAPG